MFRMGHDDVKRDVPAGDLHSSVFAQNSFGKWQSKDAVEAVGVLLRKRKRSSVVSYARVKDID